MSSEIHAAMHHDHKTWESEISLWRDDIRAWQQELAKAMASHKEIEAVLSSHGDAVRTHAGAIRLLEMEFGKHEHALADFEKGASGEELLPLAKAHQAETAKQALHRDAHERLKHYHQGLIAKLSLLMKTVQQPM